MEEGFLFPPLTEREMTAVSRTLLSALFAWYPQLWLEEGASDETRIVFGQLLLHGMNEAMNQLGQDGADSLRKKFSGAVLAMLKAQGKSIDEELAKVNENLAALGFTSVPDTELLESLKAEADKQT